MTDNKHNAYWLEALFSKQVTNFVTVKTLLLLIKRDISFDEVFDIRYYQYLCLYSDIAKKVVPPDEDNNDGGISLVPISYLNRQQEMELNGCDGIVVTGTDAAGVPLTLRDFVNREIKEVKGLKLSRFEKTIEPIVKYYTSAYIRYLRSRLTKEKKSKLLKPTVNLAALESHQDNDEVQGIAKKINRIFEEIGKGNDTGPEYAFSPSDYKTLLNAICNYQTNKQAKLPVGSIKARKTSKTQVADALKTVAEELRINFKKDKGFLNIVRAIDHYSELSDEALINYIDRRRVLKYLE